MASAKAQSRKVGNRRKLAQPFVVGQRSPPFFRRRPPTLRVPKRGRPRTAKQGVLSTGRPPQQAARRRRTPLTRARPLPRRALRQTARLKA